ncbi:hypothetical protein ACQ4PT_052654 [Festuca glaucescens]
MCTDKLASGIAAPHSPSDESPDFEQPLLYAHGGLQAGKDPAAVRDHEAQCSPKDGATSLRTYFNGLNALSGVGLLTIPYALVEGGWLSLVLLPVVTAILEGDSLNKLFPGTSLSLGPGIVVSGKHLFVVLVSIVILPTMWLRNLSVLAYISASGVVASVVLVFCVLWAAVVDGVGFQGKGRMLNVSGLPTALGLYTFCYCGHAVFPTLCNSMKEKDKYSKAIICFVACTLNYGSMAILGYLMYGDDVEPQVTLSLPEGKLISKLAIYTTLINPFWKYALMVTPVATAIEEKLLAGNKRSMKNMLIKTFIVISTVVIALTIPFFGELMAFVGSLLSVMVSMLLPCICYLKIFGTARCSMAEVVLIVMIIVLDSLVAATGTYSSLRNIIHKF